MYFDCGKNNVKCLFKKLLLYDLSSNLHKIISCIWISVANQFSRPHTFITYFVRCIYFQKNKKKNALCLYQLLPCSCILTKLSKQANAVTRVAQHGFSISVSTAYKIIFILFICPARCALPPTNRLFRTFSLLSV